MKIKDLERCVNVAWSPEMQYPIYLATGTAAQQFDASFNTNASLELYALNLCDPGMDMELKASVTSDNRFYKIVWGSHGPNDDKLNGVIVGGCDGGLVQIYSASKLLSGGECLISRQDKHNGPVQSLDFNPFQQNLLASGAAESEIYIWDLNHITTPMTPGNKSQPYENVQCLSWNRQVQHILATTFSTRCVVWDLRKNEPIIKLTDSASHIRWKSVNWHPEVATQLCLASEEDQTPVIQIWDLRFATSPLKVLDNHQRGVLSVAWCSQDSDLLISCAKDNRILCWNPNSSQPRGEVLSEIAHTLQWNFDVAWCPRNPALIAAASFDGHVSVYSLMGGKQQQVHTSNKIADSFPGMEGYAQAPAPQQAPPVYVDLAKPPKWLKRPAGASFAFGGKLVTFDFERNATAVNHQQPQSGSSVPLISRLVRISQVITEPELIEKSNVLEATLQAGQYTDYCRQKADASRSQHERYVWHFLKANFESNPKSELLHLLGYYPEDVNNAICDIVNKKTQNMKITEKQDLNLDAFESIANDNIKQMEKNKKLTVPYKIKTGNDMDGHIAQAILIGDIETAVELCLEYNRMADALIIAMTGGPDLLARTQHRYLQQSEGYVTALITALVSEDWSSVINQCNIESWKEALAAALTYCNNEELPILCERLGERLENECNGNKQLLLDAQLCYIVSGSFNKLVASWTADAAKSSDPEKLQELVELVTFMQKAIEEQGRTVTGELADLLTHYAILLASQGSLNNALNYLGSSTDPHITELRDRLYCNLGHRPAYNNIQQHQQQVSNQYGNRRISNPTRPSLSYAPLVQAPSTQTNQQFPASSQMPKYNTGLPGVPLQSAAPFVPPVPTVTQTRNTFSPGPPPNLQPPRPTSASGSSQRPKYVIDPSVQSNLPPTSTYGAAPMRTSFGAPAAPVPLMPTGHQQQQSLPPQQPMMSPFNSGVVQQPLPSMYNPNAIANQLNNNMNNIETAQPALNMMQQHQQFNNMNTTPGWNDPPAISKNARPQVPKPDVAPPAPITHPLFGSSAPADPMMNNGYGEFAPPSMPPPGPYNQMMAPPPTQGGVMNNTGGGFGAPGSYQFQQQQQPVRQPQPTPPLPTPEPPKQKGPIPEEHMYLQTVFNELQAQCSCAANNPQTKRKLDDVSRKLETLYDMLREQKLSAQTLSGLHQMVQMVQIGDYTGGLNLHTQIVSGSDFAQIASFMPGLKVLLQCALQLQVYLR